MNACNPTPPHQRHSDTSTAAAGAIKPTSATLRHQVLTFLDGRGSIGATDEEMQTALWMSPNTQRPRRVELVDCGLVADSGERRRTTSGRKAVVWKVIHHI